MAGITAADVYGLRMAFIIAVIDTLTCLTINGNRLARVIQRALIAVPSFVAEALAASIANLLRLTSAHHNVTLAAITISIVGAVHRNTF